jgi:hypothetical protein
MKINREGANNAKENAKEDQVILLRDFSLHTAFWLFAMLAAASA